MKDFYQQAPCPICGGREYSRGSVVAQGLKYVEESASFFEKSFSLGFKMTARHCDTCGNIQIFTRDEVEENR